MAHTINNSDDNNRCHVSVKAFLMSQWALDKAEKRERIIMEGNK